MVSKIDEGSGLIKTTWKEVKQRVLQVEPNFAKIVDTLSPDQTFPLYLAYYPYGAIDADTQSTFFPNMQNGFYRLTDNEAPKEVVKHLGYSINNTPLGMVLDKEIECFIDYKQEKISIPWLIYTPGKIFPFSKILTRKTQRVYEPNGLLSSTAGARSAFMLPNIGSVTHHNNLQRDFNIQSPPPKSLYEHWFVFKELVNSKQSNTSWRCCVLYFGEKWIKKIHEDEAWSRLKQYIHELAWQQYQYERNRIYYDITFSLIQKRRNLKPNPYLADTARHLFATAIGAAPGYIPIINDSSLPFDELQEIFVNSYGLKKYLPTLMKPTHFSYENDKLPIYYSLQNPSTHIFSPKSRVVSSTLSEMRELKHIMQVFIEELSNNNSECNDTIIGQIAKNVSFNFFHNKDDRHGKIYPSENIIKFDHRFSKNKHKIKHPSSKFAADAPFVRGCISIVRN